MLSSRLSSIKSALSVLLRRINCEIAGFWDAGRWLSAAPRLAVAGALLACGGCFVAVFAYPLYFLLALVLAGAALGFLIRRAIPAIVLLLLPVSMWMYTCWRLPVCPGDDISRCGSHRQTVFQGRVLELLPARDGTIFRAVVSCERLLFPPKDRVSGAVLVTAFADRVRLPSGGGLYRGAGQQGLDHRQKSEDRRLPPAPGEQVQVKGRLAEPEAARYPWEADQKIRLARRAVFSVMTVPVSAVTLCQSKSTQAQDCKWWHPAADFAGSLGKVVDSARSAMLDLHRQAIGTVDGGLLSSMVIGDRAADLPDNVSDKFRAVGLSHILAASGFNLTLVTGITWWLVRLVTRSAWAVNGSSFVAMVFFVALSGLSPSVERAAIMCSLVLLSRCFFRSLYPPAALAAALVITLLIDPVSIADIGLQLSYLATAGIICGVAPLSRAMVAGCSQLPGKLSEALSVVLVAQASVLPLQVLYFFQVGLYFLLANLAMAPVVPVITILGFVSSSIAFAGSVFACVLPLALFLDRLTDYPLKLMLWIVDLLSSCDGARIWVGPPSSLSIAIYYFCLSLFFWQLRSGKLIRTTGVLYLLSLALLFLRAAPPPLTVICSNSSLLLIDGQRQYFSYGDRGSFHISRPLAYFGCRQPANGGSLACAQSGDFSAESLGSAWLLTHKLTRFKLLVLPDDASVVPHLGQGKSSFDALVFVGGQSSPFCRSAAERSNQDSHCQAIVSLLESSGARTAVLNQGILRHCKPLSHALASVSGLRVEILPRHGSFVFYPFACQKSALPHEKI